MHKKYEFGLIGNCSFSALVEKNGNVCWLCWPRFDSDFTIGTLVDEDQGHFFVRPAEKEYETKQYYLPNSPILATEFKSESGRFRLLDFAPRFRQYHRTYKPLILHRRIEHLEGTPLIKVGCQPVFNYGETETTTFISSNHLKYTSAKAKIRLYSTLPLSYIEKQTPFALRESQNLILTYGTEIHDNIAHITQSHLQETIDYWQYWVEGLSLGNVYQEQVIRSAITLKLHQYDDTGAIIAATTTSLPEHPGSERNWDYRYCWIRDSYYTLSALNRLGKFDELKRFSKYLQNILAQTKERLQPLYSITGEWQLDEKILDLKGFLGNPPVRIGNQAYTHIQNDVYGQFLLSLLPLYVDPRFPKGQYQDLGTVQKILDLIEKYIDEPDAGLWEFRTRVNHHSYTYLFHWAGSLAAKKIAETFGDNKMKAQAERLIKKAHDGLEQCFIPEREVYGQSIQNKHLDASMFQLISMNFLKDRPEVAKKHVENLAKDLASGKDLFYRYKNADDFGKPKASFLVCSFWYVEALANIGEVDKAREIFENLLGYSNHLGLFSEDISSDDEAQWGNFPQTYSHVGVINAAYSISSKTNYSEFL